ncbi:transglycosylase domain-containing protein [Eubacteriales bacterium OttesenSCG-928-K08]|nr:transglycosylase domain-containing protein [Eubacteriales bacterium OttesenSCG-928-K08]
MPDEFDGAQETRLFDNSYITQNSQYELSEKDNGEDENEPAFKEHVRRKPFVLSVLFTTIRFFMLGAVLAGLAVLGAAVGVAKAYVETTPVLDQAQLTKSDRTSFLYDMDGNLITTIADVEYRDWVDIEDIPELLQNAFIAVEDVRFYLHGGVDFKRLFSAALEILGNKNASGGSTITQQLIKNKILGTERTYKRKVQEAYLALELEEEIEKEVILEAYLNDIHLGESNYGVKTAAMDYFGKELSELTVRECAMLAGLTQNPYRYNPRKNKYQRDEAYWEYTTMRTDKVLGNMYEAGVITLQEYKEALEEDVYILEVSEQKQMYDMPYFVEYAIRDVVTHLLTKRGLDDTLVNRSTIENELRTGGYHIYTTVDTQMQHLVQDTLANWDSYPPLSDPNNNVVTEKKADGSVIETQQPQASAVVFDYHTGELRAVVGGRTSPNIRKGLNRAYQSYMEVGSSIKPLAVYGPALDNGAGPGTVIGNFEAPIDGWGGDKGYPYVGDKKHIGPITIRRGIVSSLNVVAARTLFEWVTPEVGAQYLINLGANASKVNVDGPGLALGTSGLTTIQMAAAYGAIGAGGEYREPLAFRQVIDNEGTVILDAAEVREVRRVYKESTAYLLVDVLTNAVNSGTGTNAKISNMNVAGKTGTNSDYASVYFAGLTPYYSASIWIGHDNPKFILKSGSSGGKYAAPVWQAFMKEIHEDLPNRNIIDTPPSELGLVKQSICTVSGMLATDACHADVGGHTPSTDWMLTSNNLQTCNLHALAQICSESGQIATANCPNVKITAGSVVLVSPGSYYDQFSDEVLLTGISNFVRTPYTLEEYLEYGTTGNRCTLHSGGWSGGGISSSLSLQWQAANLRDDIIDYMNERDLPADTHNMLREHVIALNSMVRSSDSSLIRSTISAAEQAFAGVRNVYGR